MEIDVNALLFQIINFAIIIFVLQRFVLGPVKNVLDQRSEKINKGLEAAEKNLATQEELKDKKQQELKKARSEAKEIINQAKKEAEKEAQNIIKSAKQEAKDAVAKERQALESQQAKLTQEFEDKAINLITQGVEIVLKDSFTQKQQHQLIDQQIKQLESLKLS